MHTSTFTFLQKATEAPWKVLLPFLILFASFSIPQQATAQGFLGTKISISATTTSTTTTTDYTGGEATTAIDATTLTYLNGADLGNGLAFNPSSGALVITMASDTLSGLTIDSRNRPVTYPFVNSTLYYRVYLDGATAPAYSTVALSLTSSSTTSSPVTYATSSNLDLFVIPRNTGGGTYRLDLYLEGQYRKTGSTNPTPVNDPGSGAANPSSATFKVNAPSITPTGGVTRWQSRNTDASGSDWFLAANWSNGVPTAVSDAIIPENTDGTNIIFPVLNSRTVNYSVRNLTLEGATNSGRAQLTIQAAVLHVYGNIAQESGGLVGTVTDRTGIADSTSNSTLILAGSTQAMNGRLSVPDIIIAGSGVKAVLNTLLPTNTLSFRPKDAVAGVILQSSTTRNTNGVISYTLSTSGNALINLENNGKISTDIGSEETTTSYVRGIVEAIRPLEINKAQVFGNIGLEFLPNHPATAVRVQRIIGDPLIGPTTPTPGVTPVPVRRQYIIRGDDNSASTSTTGSNNTVTFHYLPSTFELNGIKQKNLTMFRTNTGSAPYTAVFGVLDSTARTVTRFDLPTFSDYYLTLGDKTNPLPVVLTAFTAARNNTNALLTWRTASEQNNKGFEVQVATDGVTYRTLTFVASHASNSVITSDYQYLDTESGKVGLRYYRLHQIDLDGTDSYSPVRTVSFTGSDVVASTLVASPNPFTDKLALSFNGTMPASGTAQVTLIDMAGRTVREQRIELSSASMDLGNLSGLRAGLYVAKIALPDGSAKMVRIQKQ